MWVNVGIFSAIDYLYHIYRIFFTLLAKLYSHWCSLLCEFQWNSKGYDVAKTWAPKFNYISPVWLQVKRQSPNIYIISGLHDVDHAWMKSVRQKGSSNNLKSKWCKLTNKATFWMSFAVNHNKWYIVVVTTIMLICKYQMLFDVMDLIKKIC